MENKINITVKTDGEEKPAVILIGEANKPALKEIFEGLNFKGLISAPMDFLLPKVEAKLINKEKVLIIVDEEKESITVLSDWDNKLQHKVEGTLVRNPDLAALKINDASGRFTLKDLVTLLKFRRLLFSSQEEFKTLLNTLMTFNAKIEADVKKENDQRGNISDAFILRAKTQLKLDFTLEAAIFKGGPIGKFKVDIYFEVTGVSSFSFYFESPDYHDLLKAQGHDLIGEQLARAEGFTVIQK
jgi:hypothetical protein